METLTTETSAVDIKQPRLLPAKLRAASIHMGISAAVFLVFLYLILVEWYPPPFFSTDGGWKGVQIMVLVDIVLGPMLTFIIFNPRKSRKEIMLDLSIIAVFQLGALAWGGYTVYNQRPIAAVEWEGTLRPLTIEPLHVQGKDLGDLQQFGTGPHPVIHAEPPRNAEQVGKMMELTLNKDIAGEQQFWLFRPFKGSFEESKRHSLNISAVAGSNAEIRRELDKILSREGAKKAEDFIYFKFTGRYKDAIFVFNNAGDQVGAITWGNPERL
ncbi:MAG: hypothetical protein HYX62_09765 [Gammaproteobacteria bacterium]|nr:hypothetical protein [Gammaproteobacteria bacterium]